MIRFILYTGLYEAHLHHDMTDANVNALNFMKLLNKDEKKVMEKVSFIMNVYRYYLRLWQLLIGAPHLNDVI